MPFFSTLGPEARDVLFNKLVSESRVNGFWIALDWGENMPPDDVEFTPTLIYEGKGAQSASNWEHIRTQLDGYGEAVTRNMGIRGVYLMGAKGQYVSFWYYRRGDLIPIKPIRVSRRGPVQIRDEAVLHPAYHVDTGFGNIHTILEFIADNPDPR
ncbi:hypothetical protein B0J17DRAFT_633755 [Rhizoctonia solani]|nr:hypothetical protein B0J17DRAFT_633755 [Rhizoctonia solani]